MESTDVVIDAANREDFDTLSKLVSKQSDETVMNDIITYLPNTCSVNKIFNLYTINNLVFTSFACKNLLSRPNLTNTDINWLLDKLDPNHEYDICDVLDILTYCDNNFSYRPYFEQFLLKLLTHSHIKEDIQQDLDVVPLELDSTQLSSYSIRVLEKYGFDVFPPLDHTNKISEKVLGYYSKDNKDDEYIRDSLMNVYNIRPGKHDIYMAIANENYNLAIEWLDVLGVLSVDDDNTLYRIMRHLVKGNCINGLSWIIIEYNLDLELELYSSLYMEVNDVEMSNYLYESGVKMGK